MEGFGYFLQGLAGGIAQAQERKSQAQEDAIRQNYLKSQKKILDAQIKTQEIEENWWNSQPENVQHLKFLPKEMQPLAFMMAGMKGLPSLGGSKLPQVPTDQSGMPVMPQEPGGGSFGDIASNIMLRSLWKKTFGLDIGELHPRTIKGKEGRPVTQHFDISGKPVGEAVEEPWKYEKVDIEGRKGTSIIYVDPYNPQKALGTIQQVTEAMKGGPGPEGIITKLPETKRVTEQDKTGKVFEFDVNKFGEEIPGTRRVKEQPKGQLPEAAGKFTMAQNSLDELTSTVSSFFTPEGTLDREILAQSKVNLPFSKGKTLKQAFKRALETSIRIMSGAAVPETEVTRYLDMFMPDILDSDEAAKAKIESLNKFLNGLISQMDPTGQLQLRSVEARSKQLNTPTPMGNKGAPQPGMIQKGYKFKGGDPSLKENWEKVK